MDRSVLWSSLAAKEEDEDDDLAPQTPSVATKSSNQATRSCVPCDADPCEGWQEILLRRNVQRPDSLVPALAPRSVPAWLCRRCCKCLLPGHRATVCRDPFSCSWCLENGHRARECRNASRPLSFLGSPTVSSLPCLPIRHQQALAPCKVQEEALLLARSPLLSTTFCCDSWASIVSAPDGSVILPDMLLGSALDGQAEMLRSELLGMASFHLEETAQPLRDVVDSMRSWMVRMGSFLQRAKAALDMLSLSPPVPQAAHVSHQFDVSHTSFKDGLLPSDPMVESVIGFADEAGVELFGSFSPLVGPSSTPPVLSDIEDETLAEVVSPVLQIMPEMCMLCGEPVSPMSLEQLQMGSLQTSNVCLMSSPPLVEPCEVSNNLPLSIMESRVLDVATLPSSAAIEQVMHVSGMTIEPLVLAPTPNPNALFAKELCDMLASVEVARSGLGWSIACLMTGTPIRGKQNKVGQR
ncbi:High affinity cationic amino acid transporter 1 [Hordeum vulgare]|nr:High affinity cationic amino acid transporter 1 [Hordeum vulgare]